MTETLIAKFAGPIWEALKYIWIAFIGLLVWIFRRQDAEIKRLQNEVSEMKGNLAQTVDHAFFEEKRKEIEKKVEGDHQRIVDTIREIHSMMREDLSHCNNGVMEQIKELRGFLISHMERRSNPRD